MRIVPCWCCGELPEASFHPTPYYKGCWQVSCENADCPERPSTWFYYRRSDAEREWNELVMGAMS